MAKLKNPVTDLGPADGVPSGTVVIKCVSGPRYMFFVDADTPAELCAEIRRRLAEVDEAARSPERDRGGGDDV